jgi:hypothetical protein
MSEEKKKSGIVIVLDGMRHIGGYPTMYWGGERRRFVVHQDFALHFETEQEASVIMRQLAHRYGPVGVKPRVETLAA